MDRDFPRAISQEGVFCPSSIMPRPTNIDYSSTVKTIIKPMIA
jgi:hypothetical protein